MWGGKKWEFFVFVGKNWFYDEDKSALCNMNTSRDLNRFL
jgi:hypothetical protein